MATIASIACITENAVSVLSLQRCADLAKEIAHETGPLIPRIAIYSELLD